MKKYEITYLTLQEEDFNAGTISGILNDHNAKIVTVHPWGTRRKLAYPIKKQDQAFYTTVVFEADQAAIQPIETALRLNNDVLRSLVVTYEPGYFDRAASQEDAKDKPETKKAEVKEEVTVEQTPAETVEEATTPEAEAPAEEEKPKRKRTVKKEVTEEETKALDEKLNELLNEDITK